MPTTNLQREMLSEFTDPSAWTRSGKGNLWRHYDGLTVTIIARRDGFFNWCVADEDGPRFSTQVHETEEEAIDSVASELIV